MKILVLNGPNLNLLGQREPDIYGTETLSDIENDLIKNFPNIEIAFKQSNSESEIITWIGEANKKYNGIILNPAAFTHTSLGIYDALKAVENQIPTIEVHLSNTHSREEIRHKSITAGACIGQIMGFQGYSYELGMHALLKFLK